MSRSQRVARNVFSMTLAQGVTWALTTFVMLYLPGYVGDVGLGRLTVAGSFVGIAFMFVNLGTGNVVVRDIARDHKLAGDYLVAILMQRLLLALAVSGIVAILANLLGYPHETKLLIYISAGFGILGSVTGSMGDVLRGQENFPRQSAAAILEKATYTVAVLIAIHLKVPLWGIAVCGGIAAVASFFVHLTAFTAGVPRPGRTHAALGKQLAIAGTPFLANAIFMSVYHQCYPLILQHISGDAAVGWYSLVTRLFGTAMFLPGIITGAMLPAISRLHTEEPDRFPDAVRRMVSFMLLCAAPMASIIIFMPGQIIRLLKYPPGFLNAVPVFVFFGIGLVVWYLSITIGTTITALDLQREFSRASAVAAAMVIPIGVACVWLTEHYLHNGAIGAAISHVIIEVYMLWRYLRVLPHGLLPADFLKPLLLKTSLAALPLGLLVYFLRGNLGLIALIPGVALYVLLCHLMRCVTRQDMDLIRGIVGRSRVFKAAA